MSPHQPRPTGERTRTRFPDSQVILVQIPDRNDVTFPEESARASALTSTIARLVVDFTTGRLRHLPFPSEPGHDPIRRRGLVRHESHKREWGAALLGLAAKMWQH